LRNAEKHNITGWVRNTSDGDVETVISGDRLAVEKMIDIIKKGPPWASVTDIKTVRSSEDEEEYRNFRIRY
jgi:acylphosphatase